MTIESPNTIFRAQPAYPSSFPTTSARLSTNLFTPFYTSFPKGTTRSTLRFIYSIPSPFNHAETANEISPMTTFWAYAVAQRHAIANHSRRRKQCSVTNARRPSFCPIKRPLPTSVSPSMSIRPFLLEATLLIASLPSTQNIWGATRSYGWRGKTLITNARHPFKFSSLTLYNHFSKTTEFLPPAVILDWKGMPRGHS